VAACVDVAGEADSWRLKQENALNQISDGVREYMKTIGVRSLMKRILEKGKT